MERIKALESVEPDVISYNSLVYALVQEPWVFEARNSPLVYVFNDEIGCPRFVNKEPSRLFSVLLVVAVAHLFSIVVPAASGLALAGVCQTYHIMRYPVTS